MENLLQDKAGKVSSKYVPASGNCTKFESGDILVGNIRPYLKKIWQADCTGGASGDVLVLRLNDESVNSRYYVANTPKKTSHKKNINYSKLL